ncbi:MAG: hypothetical protein JW809_09605 [Pirellulales bacterium]|nr:hypothetical protein [Pirellulales bacterium]
MARLSIVIPHWGSTSQLEDTLVSVLENRPEATEVVVVLRDVYGDPYDLEGEVVFVCAPIGSDPVRCLNLGIDASQGDVIHVLAPGVEVCPGWAEAALRHFADADVAAVMPWVVPLDPAGGPTVAGIEYLTRGAMRPITPEEMERHPGRPDRGGPIPDPRAGFYRKAALDHLDGFAVELGWPHALASAGLTFAAMGCRTVVEPMSRVRAGREEEVRNDAFRDAVQSERLFWRWRGGAGSVAAHCGEILLGVGRHALRLTAPAALAGRFWGFLTAGRAREHRRRLAEIASQWRLGQRAVKPPHFARPRRRAASS